MAVTIYLVSLLLIFLANYVFQHWRRVSKFPGPKLLPFFGLCFLMARMTPRGILPLMKKYADLYGGVFRVEVFGEVYFVLTEPETVEPVLSSATHITKGKREYSFFRSWLNEGLLLSNGSKWHLRRKLLTPSFHFKILESSLEGISRNAEAYVAALLATEGKPIKIHEIIHANTLRIICETAMGVKLNPEDKVQNEYTAAIRQAVNGILERSLQFWLYSDFIYRLSTAGKAYYKSIDILHTFAKQVITKKKQLFISEKMESNDKSNKNKVERKAFLDTLLELDDLNPGLFTEADIQEEVDTFMFEGHDTVSAALMFTHFLLANHPIAQEKAYAEQMEIFGQETRMPTTQDLQKMVYLEMVIKESLRLYPSVPFHTRILNKDLKIDENTVVHAGESVFIVQPIVHRSKNHWVDPDEFIPERFSPEIERHPFSFIAFSAGPRNCIGQKFAMMEMKTMLSAVLRRCKLVAVTTSVIPEPVMIMKSAEPIIMKIFPREQ